MAQAAKALDFKDMTRISFAGGQSIKLA